MVLFPGQQRSDKSRYGVDTTQWMPLPVERDGSPGVRFLPQTGPLARDVLRRAQERLPRFA